MKLVGLDTETHMIQPGLLAPPMVCVSFAEESGGSAGVALWSDDLTWLREYLTTHTIVLHNAAFDMAVLAAFDDTLLPLIFKAYDEGRIKDTKIRQQLIDIARGRETINGVAFAVRGGELVPAKYSLADLEKLYFDRDRSAEKHGPDVWRLRYAELEDTPTDDWPEEAYDYALSDAEGALKVYVAQEVDRDYVATEDLQARGDFALHLASCWGMRTDGQSVDELEALLLKESEKNTKRIKQAGFLKTRRATKDEVAEGKVDFWEDNKRGPRPMRYAKDTKAIQDYVIRVHERAGKEIVYTATGKVSTSKDSCYESGSRLLKAVADGGGVDKILNTYIPILKRGMHTPINASYNILVNSGRTSCRNPNYQNLPNGRRVGGVRECHVPSPGMVFSSTDYSTVELLALAQTCLWLLGHSKMAEAINAGQDLHLAVAASSLHMSYEEAAARYEDGDKDVKQARNVAKVANFGLPGGLGVQSLIDFSRSGYGMRFTTDEARRIKEEWTSAWPEMKGYFAWINDAVGYGKARITHPKTGYVRGALGYTEACNHFFQHLAAMGAKAALYNLTKEMYTDSSSPLFGSRLVAFIHDEFICEHPEDRMHEAATRVGEVAVESMGQFIPDLKVKAEPALMRRWYKEAKTVRDDGGRLIPWDPEVDNAA